MKRKLLFSAVAASLSALAMGEIYKFAFCRSSSRLFELSSKKSHAASFYIKKSLSRESMLALPRKRHCIAGRQGEPLYGYYYQCGEKPSGKIAFIIHGYRSNHSDTGAVFLPGYFQRGFDVFGCDHTAHGESGGELIGFDYFETQDCLNWLDFLVKEYGSDVEIVLHGFSMGGATVLRMSDRVPDNVRFIVDDSGYSSAESLLRGKLRFMYQPMRLLNRLISSYDIQDTEVYSALSRALCPILFVHGSADVTVPWEMGQDLYSCCPTEKDSLFLSGVGHIETMYYHAEEYWAKIDAFIEKYMRR